MRFASMIAWRAIAILLLGQLTLIQCNFVPKITKTKSVGMHSFQAFDDSTTLLKLDDRKVLITTDNGDNWSPIDEIKDEVSGFAIDEFYPRDRAYVITKDSKIIYITEDQGKSWKDVSFELPQIKGKYKSYDCEVVSHPTEPNELLLSCRVCHTVQQDKNSKKQNNHKRFNEDSAISGVLDDILGEFDDFLGSSTSICRMITYRSDNLGKSFNIIKSPFDKHISEGIFTFEGTTCAYAKKSKDSTVDVGEVNLICQYQQMAKVKRINNPYKVISQLFTIKGNNIAKVDFFRDKTINSIKVLNSYLIIFTQEDKINDFSNKKIWISKDMTTFKQAYVPTQLRFNHISDQIYEDTLGRIILPVYKVEEVKDDNNNNKDEDEDNDTPFKKHAPFKRYNKVLISDSTGLKFSKYDIDETDVQDFRFFQNVDFLKGTIISSFISTGVNINDQSSKERTNLVRTSISFDGGVTWGNLRVTDPDNSHKFKCDISNPETCSIISLFSLDGWESPSAGILIIMGVVSDGYSYNYKDQRTFISRDGGKTWQVALDFSAYTVSGDGGNIIVAVPYDANNDGDPASEIYFSLDQGRTWEEYQLEESVFPGYLINTTPDGSGINFLLECLAGPAHTGEDYNFLLYTIDFSDAFNGQKCNEDDVEKFYLNDGNCIGGAKYSYRRRKQNSKCLMRKIYDDLEFKEESCEQCTDADYECAFEFSKDDNGKCVPDYQLLKFSGICGNGKPTHQSIKPRQKIINNLCKKELNIAPEEISCSSLPDPAKSSEKITVTENKINGKIEFYQYFDTTEDESLIIGTSKFEFYVSHDGGQSLERINTDNERVVEIVYNPYSNTSAYLFTAGGSIYTTHDRGYTFDTTKLPQALQLGFPLDFHADDPNTFIYYGGKDCEAILSPKCHAVAYITRDGGRNFEELLDNASHCDFTGSKYKYAFNKDMIMCEERNIKTNERSLVSSTDGFHDDKKVVFENIIGYMTSGGFTIVAVSHGNKELRAYVTVDGSEFAEAKLPQDLGNIKQETFTVLGTDTGSIFLHMATNIKNDESYGDLLKSNSNGTSFVTLQKLVNSDNFGQVDFEKIQGLEGIILLNTVENADSFEMNEGQKQLKTKITFNDGADWSYLKPPARDSAGKKYNCNPKTPGKCSLNLHGYTERTDIRDTFSSGSAHGMMIGVGSVGEHLLTFKECSTFLTIDGGETWTEVKQGPHQWEFGDHGGILVLAPDKILTDTLSYSLDSGKTWSDYKFTEESIVIRDLVTIPQDSALRFLLIGESNNVNGASTTIYALDFSGIFERQCNFEINNNKNDDFAYVSISPSETECLFGHQEEYLKKTRNTCFVGNIPLSEFSRVVKNCACNRKDFECDYNYYKANDGTCKLVEGLSPAPETDICKKNPESIEFSEPTGYRKIPLSTCEGGLKLDISSDTYPCPGKEVEFSDKYGIKGRSFFLIFFIPFLLFSGLLYFIYDQGIRRNGGFSRFGEIRLGDDQLIENNKTDKIINSIVQFGVVAYSGMFSVFQLTKRASRGLFERFSGRFSTRRGPSYSSLMNDQFLDEADDLLAGHDADANDLSSFMDSENNFDIEDEPTDNTTTDVDDVHKPYSDNVASEDIPAPIGSVGSTKADTSTDLNASE